MSFTIDNLLADGDIEVILRQDSALDMTDEEYADYIKSMDEALVKLKPGGEATKFVMRRNVTLKHATRIENSKLKYDGGDGDVSVQLGFIIEEVRASLKGVVYPSSSNVPKEKQIVLKFTGDGLVDERQMAAFVACGIVNNLYNARQSYLKNAMGGGDLKKS